MESVSKEFKKLVFALKIRISKAYTRITQMYDSLPTRSIITCMVDINSFEKVNGNKH